MSKELIKIVTNNEGVKVVSARELHQGLGVGKVFGAWIKNRIDKYGFIENEDYTTLTKNLVSMERFQNWKRSRVRG